MNEQSTDISSSVHKITKIVMGLHVFTVDWIIIEAQSAWKLSTLPKERKCYRENNSDLIVPNVDTVHQIVRLGNVGNV